MGDKLCLFIGGNLETNYNKLDFFFDSKSGGQNQLTGNMQYVAAMNGLTFDAGFQADYALSLTCGSPAQAYADYAPIPKLSRLTGPPHNISPMHKFSLMVRVKVFASVASQAT